MTALLIDAGNSRIRVKEWTARSLPSRRVAGGETVSGLDRLAEVATSDFLAEPEGLQRELDTLLGDARERMLVLTSVVPRVTELLVVRRPRILVIDHRMTLPFPSRVEAMDKVGPDRICNVAAAAGAGLGDAIVVDAGTATTFDVLCDGEFQGGLIAPGMEFASSQLGRIAARLEPVPFGPRPLAPAVTTAEAMAAGAWHCGVGGVEAVLDGLLATLPAATVVLTGGLGHHLGAPGRILDPDWTLRGAAQLAGLVER